MKDSLHDQLARDYPEMFEKNDFELSIGNGWYQIIHSLLGIITSPVSQAQFRLKFEKDRPEEDNNPRKIEECELMLQKAITDLPVIMQVKEKFGGLRFYYQGGDTDRAKFIDGAVRMAEAMADRTCHVCGSPGERRPGDWIQTLCDKHYNEQEEHTKARKQGRRLPAINYDAETED